MPRPTSAFRSASLSVANGVISGGGQVRHLRAAARREALQHEDRDGEPQSRPGHLEAGQLRTRSSAPGCPGSTCPRRSPGRTRTCTTSVSPACCTGASCVRAARGRSAPARRSSRSTSARSAHISGARVVRQGDFLGVVAPREYDAIQAAAQLKVTWKESAILPTPGKLFKQMRAQDSAGLAKAVFTVNNGNVDAGLAVRGEEGLADLHLPERLTCGDRPGLRSGRRQGELRDGLVEHAERARSRHVVAGLLGIPAAAGSGHLLRGLELVRLGPERSDTPKAAALMSKLAGAPVRLQLMRWDEHGWDNYQSAHDHGRPRRSRREREADCVRLHADVGAVLDGDRPDIGAHRVAVSDDDDRCQGRRPVDERHVRVGRTSA